VHHLVLRPSKVESPREAGAHEAGAGLRERGLSELEDRRRVVAAAAALRRRVDAALPGLFRWFPDAALHVTLRPLIL
jgi:hypothetical protein